MEDFFKLDPSSIGSKGLVFIGNKILVYRRGSDTTKYPRCIDLPGGGPKPGETPFVTFKREVKEEFGLDITKADVVWARRYRSSEDQSRFAHYPVAKLPAEAAQMIKFGDEGTQYLLMPLSKYLGIKDAAWPILQRRASDYVMSVM